MAWLTDKELETLEKKAGFIGVIHREGYEERKIEVRRLIEEYRRLKEEIKDEKTGGILLKGKADREGLNPNTGGKGS